MDRSGEVLEIAKISVESDEREAYSEARFRAHFLTGILALLVLGPMIWNHFTGGGVTGRDFAEVLGGLLAVNMWLKQSELSELRHRQTNLKISVIETQLRLYLMRMED